MVSALEQLRARRAAAPPAVRAGPLAGTAAGLTLAALAGSGRVLAVHSDVLGEPVLLAGDGADLGLWLLTRPERRGCLVYRARELALLLDAGPDGLRRVHEAKRLFGGEVVA